jgi:hypothetical protein
LLRTVKIAFDELCEIVLLVSSNAIICFCLWAFMPRRNKWVAFAALPVALLLWFVGWSLFWLGSKDQKFSKKARLNAVKDNVVFLVSAPELQNANVG